MLRKAEELRGAGAADQPVRRVTQVDQRGRVAAAGRFDEDREELEASRKLATKRRRPSSRAYREAPFAYIFFSRYISP